MPDRGEEEPTGSRCQVRRVKLEDVARICGVSKITVSRALRKSPQVRPEVRERIERAAREAGYRVNLAARDLRLSHRRRVAIVVDWKPDEARPMSDPYPLVLLGGAVEALATAGYAAVVTTNDPSMRDEASDTSGVILLGQGADHDTVHEYRALALPTVVWGEDDGADRVSGVVVVGSDNRLGGTQAADHLIGRGCGHCLFLGDTRHAELRTRKEACAQALAANNRGTLMEVPCEFTAASAETVMDDVLSLHPEIDGIFAGSDLIAVGAKRAIARAGRSIPIVGYDDSPAAAAFDLTTVSQDWIAGGKLLAQVLLQLIAGQRPEPRPLPTHLVVRNS